MGGNENAMYTRGLRAFFMGKRSICEKKMDLPRPRYAPGAVDEKGVDEQYQYHRGGNLPWVPCDLSRDNINMMS